MNTETGVHGAPSISSSQGWAIGLFEGEGCISFSSKRKRRQPRLMLVSTDEDVVRRFAAIVGCGSIHPQTKRRDHWKLQWKWACGEAGDVEKVLTWMLPHLGERRRARASEVLELCAAYRQEKSERQCPICGATFVPMRGGLRIRRTCGDPKCARKELYLRIDKPRRALLPKKSRVGIALTAEHRAKIAEGQRRAWAKRKQRPG